MTFTGQKMHEPIEIQRRKLILTPFAVENQGTFNIEMLGNVVGNVDIAKHSDETHVSVELIDTFLTIDQLTELMIDLKNRFGLSSSQKVSIQQI